MMRLAWPAIRAAGSFAGRRAAWKGKTAAEQYAAKLAARRAGARFARKVPGYGSTALGAAGALGTVASIPFMYDAFTGGYDETAGTGPKPEDAMSDDMAMALLDQEIMNNREDIFERDILGPVSKGLQRIKSPAIPSNMPSIMQDVAANNLIQQRAARLAELSQPVDQSPSLLEIAHNLGLPID
jgi:hypothetical protein